MTPSPNWYHKPTNLPVSTTPPLDENQLGSMDFNLWKEIGNEFMIKSTINNWLICSEMGGSLVEMRNGLIECNITKVIVPGPCEDVVPFVFEKHGTATTLMSPNGGYYYFHTKGVVSHWWAVSDPCGRKQENQLTGVLNPALWIYIRKKDPPVQPVVAEIFDANNSTSKKLFSFLQQLFFFIVKYINLSQTVKDRINMYILKFTHTFNYL